MRFVPSTCQIVVRSRRNESPTDRAGGAANLSYNWRTLLMLQFGFLPDLEREQDHPDRSIPAHCGYPQSPK